jgi:hypothetical protein
MSNQGKRSSRSRSTERYFFGPLAGHLFVSLTPDGASARYFYPSGDGGFEEVSAEESARRTRACLGGPAAADVELEPEPAVRAMAAGRRG